MIAAKSGFCQKILVDSDFPALIEFQGAQRVLLTLPQVDSLNFVYSYLDECREYNDSLKSTIDDYDTIINLGKKIEKGLLISITEQRNIINLKDNVISEQEKANKKLMRKYKFFKIVYGVLGVGMGILLVIVLIA